MCAAPNRSESFSLSGMESPTLRHVLARRFPCSVFSASLIGLWLVAAGCGSGGGTEGPPPVLPEVSEVSVGSTTCPTGGVRVRIGADDNRDGDLDSDEVDSSSYICNGENMVEGWDDVLVRTVELLVGDEDCPSGGRRVDFGVDNGDGTGLPGNDILENDEVDTSFLDCDGATGVMVTPPPGATGTFVFDTHGGAGETEGGGDGGDIEEGSSQETHNSYLMIANTGSADASCATPALSVDMGSVPAAFTSDATVAVVAAMDEASLADGTVFARADDTALFVWDGTNGVARRATGLSVAADVTVTLPITNSFGASGIELSFARDVSVAGTLTTVSTAGQRGRLRISARQIHLAATSTLALQGGADERGALLDLLASGDLVALGAIDTTGASGTAGFSGGDVNVNASGALYTAGTIVTVGGSGTAGAAGNGGSVSLASATRILCNAADITTDGGDADGVAGNGGAIHFGDDCVYGAVVDIRNSGDLRARGGNESGACSGPCSAGAGGDVRFIAIGGSAIFSSGSLDTRGGVSENVRGGAGGPIGLRSGQFTPPGARVVLYEVSGNITTFGGDGHAGGGHGGGVEVSNLGGVGSATRFLGYASVTTDGGDGDSGGGVGGSLSFLPEMDWTEGGHGLYVYSNVSATGGDGGDANGGEGGSIAFRPAFSQVEGGSSSLENVVIVGTIDLSGGRGTTGGQSGSISANDGCGPALSATGIRVAGDITLDGGDGTDGSGGAAGRVFLITARGAVSVSGTIHTVGGASTSSQGGYFAGSSFFGAPTRFSADVTAGGGSGGTTGGVADDIAILSAGAASTVTGTITLAGGAGPTAAMDGRTGLVRVDTGTSCIGP